MFISRMFSHTKSEGDCSTGTLVFVDETPLVLWHILSAALKNTLLDLIIQTVPQEVVTHTTEHMMAKINASLSC